MKRLCSFLLALLFLLTGADAARAITAVPRDFDELVARADTVFKGSVTRQESRWVGEGAKRHIATFVTFQVEETYKGAPTGEQTLRFLGGVVGDEAMKVADMPEFAVGQKAVLFVVGNNRQYCPLVGADQGRFHVVKDAATGRERIFTNDRLPVVNTADIGWLDETGAPRLRRDAHAATPALAAEDFRAEILRKVAALPH